MTELKATIYEPPEEKESPGALVQIEQQRAVQEVQAAVIVAKRFPRNEEQCLQNILKACRRRSLAERAKYAYPRGGTVVEGPSIRLAEVLAAQWQNMQYGIRELDQREGVSEVESYAWDLQTNVRASRHFQVRHIRWRKTGAVDLEDPRDIYEMAANQGARRLRACILEIIPGDIVEEAENECEKTLKQSAGEPIEARVRKMVGAFADQGVNVEMIEKRLGHKLSITTETELVQLRKIYQSIKDHMAKREDFFEYIGSQSGPASQEKKPESENQKRKPRSDKGKSRKEQFVDNDKNSGAGFTKGGCLPTFKELREKELQESDELMEEKRTGEELPPAASYVPKIADEIAEIAFDKLGWTGEQLVQSMWSRDYKLPEEMTPQQIEEYCKYLSQLLEQKNKPEDE